MTPQDHGRAAFVALLQAALPSQGACCPTVAHARRTARVRPTRFNDDEAGTAHGPAAFHADDRLAVVRFE